MDTLNAKPSSPPSQDTVPLKPPSTGDDDVSMSTSTENHSSMVSEESKISHIEKDENTDKYVTESDEISNNSSLNIGKEKGLVINNDFGTLPKHGASSELTTEENNETISSCVNESTHISNSSTTNISKETADKVLNIFKPRGISLELTTEETLDNLKESKNVSTPINKEGTHKYLEIDQETTAVSTTIDQEVASIYLDDSQTVTTLVFQEAPLDIGKKILAQALVEKRDDTSKGRYDTPNLSTLCVQGDSPTLGNEIKTVEEQSIKITDSAVTPNLCNELQVTEKRQSYVDKNQSFVKKDNKSDKSSANGSENECNLPNDVTESVTELKQVDQISPTFQDKCLKWKNDAVIEIVENDQISEEKDETSGREIYEKYSDDDVVIVSSDDEVSSKLSSDKTDESPFSSNCNMETDVELSELQKNKCLEEFHEVDDDSTTVDKDVTSNSFHDNGNASSSENQMLKISENATILTEEVTGKGVEEFQASVNTSATNDKEVTALTDLNNETLSKECQKVNSTQNTSTPTNAEAVTGKGVDEVQEDITSNDNEVVSLTELNSNTKTIETQKTDTTHNTANGLEELQEVVTTGIAEDNAGSAPTDMIQIQNKSSPTNDEEGTNKSENEVQETFQTSYKEAATLTELNIEPTTKENKKDDTILNMSTRANEEEGTYIGVDEVQEAGNAVTSSVLVKDICKQSTVVAKYADEPTQIEQGNPKLDENNLKRKHDAVEKDENPNNNINNNKIVKKDDVVVVISSDEKESKKLDKKAGQISKTSTRGAIKVVKLECLTKPEFRAEILKPHINSVELNLNNTSKITATNSNKKIKNKSEKKEIENKRWFERYKKFCNKMQQLKKFPAAALSKSEMESKIKMEKYIANFEKLNKDKRINWDAGNSSRNYGNKNENKAKKDNSSASTEKSGTSNNNNHKPDNKQTNRLSNSAKHSLSSNNANSTVQGPVIYSQPKIKYLQNPVVKKNNLQSVQSNLQRIMPTTPLQSYNPQRQSNINDSITFDDFIMTKSSRNMNTNSSYQSNQFSEWNSWPSSPSMTQMNVNQNSRSNTINQTNKSSKEFNSLSNTKPLATQGKRIDSESSAPKSKMGKLQRDRTTHTTTKTNTILPSTTTTSNSIPTHNSSYRNQNRSDSSSLMKIKMAFIDRTDPEGMINEEKWTKIEEQLLKALIREINNPYMKDIFTAFNGFQWEMGIKVIECNNQKAVQFLENSICNMRPLTENIECVPSSHVLKRTIVCLTVPPPKLDNEVMLKLLKQQNKDLLANSWKIVHSHPKGNCIEIKVEISEASADLIKKSSNPRIRIGMNQLSVTFTTKK